MNLKITKNGNVISVIYDPDSYKLYEIVTDMLKDSKEFEVFNTMDQMSRKLQVFDMAHIARIESKNSITDFIIYKN